MKGGKFWRSVSREEIDQLILDMKRRKVGKLVALPCRLVIGKLVWRRCESILKLFSRGRKVTEENYRETDYYRFVLWKELWLADKRAGVCEAFAEKDVWSFYGFYHDYISGKARIRPPLVFLARDFSDCMRGKHRTSILRFAGERLIECVVVTTTDVLKWRASRKRESKSEGEEVVAEGVHSDEQLSRQTRSAQESDT